MPRNWTFKHTNNIVLPLYLHISRPEQTPGNEFLPVRKVLQSNEGTESHTRTTTNCSNHSLLHVDP